MRSISVTNHDAPPALVGSHFPRSSHSTRMPWLDDDRRRGGWVNAIGGTHGSLISPAHAPGPGSAHRLAFLDAGGRAMAGRGLSVKPRLPRRSSCCSSWHSRWYQRFNVNPPVAVGHSWVLVPPAGCVVGCSLWAAVNGRFCLANAIVKWCSRTFPAWRNFVLLFPVRAGS